MSAHTSSSIPLAEPKNKSHRHKKAPEEIPQPIRCLDIRLIHSACFRTTAGGPRLIANSAFVCVGRGNSGQSRYHHVPAPNHTARWWRARTGTSCASTSPGPLPRPDGRRDGGCLIRPSEASPQESIAPAKPALEPRPRRACCSPTCL